MTLQEAQELQLSGKYSDLLRAAVEEQVRAAQAGDIEGEVAWTMLAAKACRWIGRTYEGNAHATHAAIRAAGLKRPDLVAEAVYHKATLAQAEHKYDEAAALLDRAIDLLPAETPPFVRAVYELERAELALEMDRPEEAQASLARGAARVHLLENTRLLAWTLYLRARLEKASTAAGLLAGAHSIAHSIDIPELEWHILWRLAECMRRVWDFRQEEDCIRRAMAILKGLASRLVPQDQAAFWRQGARFDFAEYVRYRFGESFKSDLPRAPEAKEPSELPWWDPALLPAFVQESLKAGVRI